MSEVDLNAQESILIGEDVIGRDKHINTQGDMVGGDKFEGDKIGGDQISITYTHEPPVPIINSLHQLPSPPRDFTGREAELVELVDKLEHGGITITGLRGMGGIGKTALALKLAEKLALDYPDAQLYVDLRGASSTPLSPSEAMAQIIRAYHPTAMLPESEPELQKLYRSVLHGQKALVLLDDARNAAQVNPLLPPVSCLLLVTSRQHLMLPGLFAKDLDVMPEGDATALVLHIAPRIDEHAGKISRLCGYLPLALRVAASALAEQIDLAPADHVCRLADATQRLKLTSADASLSLSYDLLTSDSQSRWRALAVFPGDFDRAAAAAVWNFGADPATGALSELLRYSLVDFLPPPTERGNENGRYHLHDLAKLFAETRLGEDERYEVQARHAKHYESVLRSAKKLYKQGGDAILRGLALFDLEWHNIEKGQAWAAHHAEADDAAAKMCDDYPDAGADILGLRLNPRDHHRWLEAALAAARRLGHREAEGAHIGNLGNIYADLGDACKAIKYFEQALVTLHEISDRRGEGATLGNLVLQRDFDRVGTGQHACPDRPRVPSGTLR
ncbi:MAG: hypothetical protein JW850_17200, partial [Thermoflexales bacterium]|nr:hypothetical protein [Thermoflexales bacterium]